PSHEFIDYLQAYTKHYQEFLNEKTVHPISKKWHYTHKRLRSAVKSLHTNLDHLFTYEKYPHKKIPRTTNSLESHFSHIKTITKVHRGLKRETKEKVVETILLNSSIIKDLNQ